MPVVVNLACDLNERLLVTGKVTVDGTATGAPVPIAGWTLAAVIHKVAGDGLPLFTYTPVFPAGGADGVWQFAVPNADVRTLGPGTFAYYVARTDAGSEADLTRGRFTVRAV